MVAALLVSSAASAQAPTYGVALETGANVPGRASDSDRYNYPNHAHGALRSNAIASSASADAGPYGIVTGEASASANLATGELKGYATGSLNRIGDAFQYGGGYAFANLFDTLYFDVAGATATTVTPITLLFESEGSFADIRNEADVQHIYSGSLASKNNGPGAGFLGIYQFGNISTSAAGLYLAGATWLNSDADHFKLRLVYNLVGAKPEMAIDLKLYAVAAYGAVADFSHTATVGMILPDEVTYTSASGAFLTQSRAPVPEPGAWALMILGFGAIGATLRRRPNSTGAATA